MKFTAAKQELMKSLNIVLKAVPSKTTMSILYSILIDATVDTIRFTGNDMELGIETVVEGQIEERGLICLDAKLLSEIVRKLPDEDVTIQTDKDYQTTITCGNSVFRITGRDGTEFSPLPSIDKKDPVILSQFQLRELIRQTIFSTAMSETNQLMTGELFEIANGALKVVALDGHRIAIRNLELRDGAADQKVVPSSRQSPLASRVSRSPTLVV